MREIKFRAWDNKRKNWVHGERFRLSINGNIIFDFDIPADKERFVVQQYTGLEDKNGMEIYEGDIVNLDDGTRNPYQVVWDESFSGWAFGKLIGINSLFSMYGAGIFEVIGNIYENQELLK